VHSIAAGLLLKKEEIHFFNDIAYYHVPFTHCPTGEKLRTDLRCHCNPKDNFDWKGYSCEFSMLHVLYASSSLTRWVTGTSRYFDINGLSKPEGWENQQD
jgi:alpha 1,2-mannosyltransferase